MRKQYPDALIEQALKAAKSRGNRSIRSVAEELDIEYETLKKWLQRKSVDTKTPKESKEKRPQDWGREEQLAALMQTHGLSEESVNAWCREHGIFPHHLVAWKADFTSGASVEAAQDQRSARTLKHENEKLKVELRRKDKALAEAAALLVLQKKFRALWETEDK